MSADEFADLFSVEDEERRAHPMRAAQASMRKPVAKRFYTLATMADEGTGFRLLLDGRGALTPKRAPLCLPTQASAALVVAEWNSQIDVINPSVMHATRIANAAIDHVALAMVEVRDDAARYAASDMICYRASEPDRLVARQNHLWGPIADWFEGRIGAPLVFTSSISFVAQSAELLAAYRVALDAIRNPVALAAFHVMVTLSGSAIIALAVAEGQIGPAEAFAASELDSDFEVEAWGTDDDATQRRANREAEFLAAAGLYLAVKSAG
jgi:chaperone required for assembly of F1-ATPase